MVRGTQFQCHQFIERVRLPIGKESVPIQLAQCWFPGLAISNAKKIYLKKIKYTQEILQTALGDCYGLKLANDDCIVEK